MIPAIMAGASLIGGITGSRSSRKEAKKARELQEAMFAFERQRYNDFKSKYGDIENQLVADAKKGVIADLDGVTSRAAADVATQFGNAEESRLRNMQRMGINPNSGRADALASRNAIAKSLASAGNITAGREAERRNAEQQTWNRRSGVAQFGAGLMQNAASGMNNAMNAMASTAAQQSANQASQAGALFGAAGQLAGAGAFDGVFGGKAASAPTTAPVAGISRPEYLPMTPTQGQQASSLVGDLMGGKIPGLSAFGF